MTTRSIWFVAAVLVVAACGGADEPATGEASADEWCELARRIEDNDLLTGTDGETPEAVEASLGELQSLFDEAARSAPEQILADVNTTADGVDDLARVLADAGFAASQIDESALVELDRLQSDIDEASGRIEAYNEAECGIVPPVDDDEATVAAPDLDSDWCVAARDVESASDVLDADDFDFTDPAAVESAFAEMLSSFESALAVAPPEIAGDVQTSYDGFVQLRDALAEVEYDFLLADLAVIDELDAEMDAAGEAIETYNEDVCAIPADDDDGIGDDDDGDGGDFDPSAGSIREQTIAELVAQGFTAEEAGCIFDGIDLTDPDLGTDNSIIIQVFDECGIDLARLAELGG